MKKLINEIKFSDDGLVPVVAQDVKTDAVLMLAYANKEALEKTVATKQAHYYSRSRKKLWRKGEDSGNEQELVSLAIDCDGDAVIYKVKQKGPACHTGNYTCFYRKSSAAETQAAAETSLPVTPTPVAETPNSGDGASERPAASLDVITSLAETIADRKKNPKDGSYTNYLFDKGMDKILKKIGEESSEVIIAAKNADNAEIAEETADLLYHLLVMFEERGISIGEVMRALGKR